MEVKKMELTLSPDIYEKLEAMAKEADLSVTKLGSVLISTFIEHNGKVFTGKWAEGPGIRLLPDWPRFSSGVVKIKKEKMKI
ncbi:MAG: hypothetical protein ABII26_05250 [Pseudomonadota bacterium]